MFFYGAIEDIYHTFFTQQKNWKQPELPGKWFKEL